MKQQLLESLPPFLEILGLDEEPMGIFYTDQKPADGFSPAVSDLPTREKEMRQKQGGDRGLGSFGAKVF